MTMLVVENLEESNQRKLFSLMDVDVAMTKTAWLNIPLMLILGIVVSWFLAPAETVQAKILIGIGYGLLMMLVSFCHGLGHIISSRMIGAAMTRLIWTATVYTTYYDDSDASQISSRQHIGRAIGGPAFNLLLGMVVLIINALVLHNHFALLFGISNIVFGLISLLPLPTVDGEVLLRELRRSQ